MKPRAHTPWGPAQTVEVVGTIGRDTIYNVTTASHGGYFVPKRLLAAIPQSHQNRAARWSGSPQWYEEDCEWASVAVAFPQFFTPKQLEHAQRMQTAREQPRAAQEATP